MERIPEFIANHLFLVTLFFAILILLLWNLFGSTLGGINQLSPTEMTHLINHENAVVLDVRNSDDFKRGHVLSAMNFPEPDLGSRQKELEKYHKRTVILVCNNGSVSTRVARMLKKDGFEKIHCLNGGIYSWQNANLPLTK